MPRRSPGTVPEDRSLASLRASHALALEELYMTVASSHAVEGVWIFGSVARHDDTDTSDLDLLFVLGTPRSQGFSKYSATQSNGTKVDLNVLTRDELPQLISDPHWQYRLMDATSVRVTGRSSRVVSRWIADARQWCASQESQLHRIEVLRTRLAGLAQLERESRTASAPHTAQYLLLHGYRLSMLLNCELEGRIPFCDQVPAAPDGGAARDLSRFSDPYTPELSWSRVTEVLHKATPCVTGLVPFIRAGRDPAEAILSNHALLSACEHSLSQAITLTGDSASTEAVLRAYVEHIHVNAQNVATCHPAHLRAAPGRSVTRKASSSFRFREYDASRLRLKVILATGGCRVPTCTFCQLPDLAHAPQQRPIKLGSRTCLDISGARDIDEIAIYTDGSFFDDREVSLFERSLIAEEVKQLSPRAVLVESLPCFVNEGVIHDFRDQLGTGIALRLGVGLQSSSERLRRLTLGTPIRHSDMCDLLTRKGQFEIGLRIYLLLGKPLLDPCEDIEDVLRSAAWLSESLNSADVITVNAMRIAEGTVVHALAAAGLYFPPSLCDLRATVERLRGALPQTRIEPGCVAVSTCTSEPHDGRPTCVACKSWLLEEERQRSGESLPCTRTADAVHALPWRAMGALERRCSWATRQLDSAHRQVRQ